MAIYEDALIKFKDAVQNYVIPDAEKFNTFVTGDENATIETAAGTIPSLAGMYAEYAATRDQQIAEAIDEIETAIADDVALSQAAATSASQSEQNILAAAASVGPYKPFSDRPAADAALTAGSLAIGDMIEVYADAAADPAVSTRYDVIDDGTGSPEIDYANGRPVDYAFPVYALGSGLSMTRAEAVSSLLLRAGQVRIIDGRQMYIVAGSTYTANGDTVIDLTGSGLQAVLAPNEKLQSYDEFSSDTRPDGWFYEGAFIGIGGPTGGWRVQKTSDAALIDQTTEGGATWEVMPTILGYNVRSFGARGDDSDDSAALQKCVNRVKARIEAMLATTQRTEGRSIFVPNGTYGTSGLLLNEKVQFRGESMNGVFFKGLSPDQDYVVKAADSLAQTYRSEIGNFSITGYAKSACVFKYVRLASIRNINLSGRSVGFENGFVFDVVFGCTIENLFTSGVAISNACFYIQSAFNANTCNNWYTANSNVPYNLLIDPLVGDLGERSYGNTFNALTLQGGVIGMWIKNTFHRSTFNSLYTENTVKPVVIGDVTGQPPRALTFNSPALSGPYTNHPSYASRVAAIDLVSCRSIMLNAPEFNDITGAVPSVWAIRLGNARKITVTSAALPDGPNENLWEHTVRATDANSDSAITMINCGRSADSYETQSILLPGNDRNGVHLLTGGVSRGLSPNSVPVVSRNRCGSVALNGSNQAVVSFAESESDGNYRVTLAGNTSETIYWSNKTASGFTVNSSEANSTATVDWRIERLCPELRTTAIVLETADGPPS